MITKKLKNEFNFGGYCYPKLQSYKYKMRESQAKKELPLLSKVITQGTENFRVLNCLLEWQDLKTLFSSQNIKYELCDHLETKELYLSEISKENLMSWEILKRQRPFQF
ncbi:unnamed protein product [Paramecium octaurelia]|uniref:Uncharacterized protein n=1 Tax=Paramecium octaurelia TaxID=43137 RepID=A0A8S1YKJ4_PAROT|nr:unnamed protein product [Paramecium octaurelia]